MLRDSMIEKHHSILREFFVPPGGATFDESIVPPWTRGDSFSVSLVVLVDGAKPGTTTA